MGWEQSRIGTTSNGRREDMGRRAGRVRDPPCTVGGAALGMSWVAVRFKKKRKSLGAEAGEEKGSGVRRETQGPASVES